MSKRIPLAYTHENLPESAMRDFLSKAYQKALDDGAVCHPSGEEHVRKQIAELEKKLEATKIAYSVKKLADLKGWEFTDTSDVVDYDPATWYMFLGTKTELAQKFPELAAEQEDDE